jgi:hypothetical protein
MYNYTLKLNKSDSESSMIEKSSVAPIEIGHHIAVGEDLYLVFSICHCDKGVIICCDKI